MSPFYLFLAYTGCIVGGLLLGISGVELLRTRWYRLGNPFIKVAYLLVAAGMTMAVGIIGWALLFY